MAPSMTSMRARKQSWIVFMVNALGTINAGETERLCTFISSVFYRLNNKQIRLGHEGTEKRHLAFFRTVQRSAFRVGVRGRRFQTPNFHLLNAARTASRYLVTYFSTGNRFCKLRARVISSAYSSSPPKAMPRAMVVIRIGFAGSAVIFFWI